MLEIFFLLTFSQVPQILEKIMIRRNWARGILHTVKPAQRDNPTGRSEFTNTFFNEFECWFLFCYRKPQQWKVNTRWHIHCLLKGGCRCELGVTSVTLPVSSSIYFHPTPTYCFWARNHMLTS